MPRQRLHRKLVLTGVFLSLALLVPVASQRSQSLLMTDPYWRYQEALWARHIADTGRLWPFSTPPHSFLTWWVTEFDDNLGTPIVVRFLADFSGLDVQAVQVLPLFGFVLVLSQAVLASRLANRPSVFPVAVVLGVAFQFQVPHIATSAHRGAMAWASLVALLAFLAVVRERRTTAALVGVAVLTFGFVTGAHTLPVASLLLLSVVYMAGRLSATPLLDRRQYLVITGIIVLYYGIAFDWLVHVVTIFLERVGLLVGISPDQLGVAWYHAVAVACLGIVVTLAVGRVLRQIQGPKLSPRRVVMGVFAGASVAFVGFVLAFSPAELLAAVRTSGSVHPIVLQYQNNALVTNSLYDAARWVARLTALGLVGTAALYRGVALWRSPENVTEAMTTLDVLFVGVMVQGVASVFILPFFAPSGGISPLLLGLFVTPVFGGYLLDRLLDSYLRPTVPWRKVVTAGLVVLLVSAPAFAVFTAKPTTDGMQIISTTETDVEQAEWADANLPDRRLTSDFTTLSTYYTVGGDGRTHLPRGGSPAYSSGPTARLLVETYYTNPPLVAGAADAYLVRGQMEEYGMAHRASITTVPNPDLSTSLSRSPLWSKVYTTGSDETFVVANSTDDGGFP